MPYLSMAQARKFHSDPKLKRYTAEYDAATNFTHLPERAGKAKHPDKRKHRKHRHDAIARMLAAGGNLR